MKRLTARGPIATRCRLPYALPAMLCALAVACLCSCDSGSQPRSASDPSADRLPPLGPSVEIEDGILLHTVQLTGKGERRTLWIYLPKTPAASKLPCVLIAPAGSALIHGMALAEADRPEHVPYVRAGFAVVAFELNGIMPEVPLPQEFRASVTAFIRADAGLANASAAIDYVTKKVSAVDSRRLYAAGHSSAATVSLYVAEHEPRIKACIAYAPAPDLQRQIDDELKDLCGGIRGFKAFLRQASPMTHAKKLKCPLYLFHATDDSVCPVAETERFRAAVLRTNSNVTFLKAVRGGHYDSMINLGVPQAIEWLKRLDRQ